MFWTLSGSVHNEHSPITALDVNGMRNPRIRILCAKENRRGFMPEGEDREKEGQYRGYDTRSPWRCQERFENQGACDFSKTIQNFL